MSARQIIEPDTSVRAWAYACLNHSRRVFGVPAVHATAWQAWDATEHYSRQSSTLPRNVAVPVWFQWFGTVNGEYKNWGHVVVYIPGRGFISSPQSGYGAVWYKSISDVERRIPGAKFVGWSYDINGVMVAEPVEASSEDNGWVHPQINESELEEMLWIADVNGHWRLIVPNGGGKPNAVTLSGSSGMGGGGAAKAGIPVIKFKSDAELRKVANIV